VSENIGHSAYFKITPFLKGRYDELMIYQVILAHFYLAAQDLFRHWKTFDRQQKEEMGKKSFPEARAAARRGQNIILHIFVCQRSAFIILN
jgi:hypothetical protein